jgi:hypothetical protein
MKNSGVNPLFFMNEIIAEALRAKASGSAAFRGGERTVWIHSKP